MLCLFQIFQHIDKHIVSHGIIFGGSIFMDRKTCIIPDISRLYGSSQICAFKILSGLFILFDVIGDLLQHHLRILGHLSCHSGLAEQEIDHHSENRHSQDQDGPGKLIGRVDLLIHDPQHQDQAKDTDQIHQMSGKGSHPPKHGENPGKLKKDRHCGKKNPAGYDIN